MTAPTAATQPTAADRAWFAERIEALLPELFGRALRLCRHRANAEDLVADAVARAWEALPSLEERESFRGWVFRILNNRFVSGCRSARARAEHESLDAPIGGDAAGPADGPGADGFSLFERLHQPVLLWSSDPEMEFLNRLLREDLARAIDALPDAYGEVVVLVDVQGLAYAEVAELLAIPIGTVRSRLARARGRLQRALWEHGREAGLTTGGET